MVQIVLWWCTLHIFDVHLGKNINCLVNLSLSTQWVTSQYFSQHGPDGARLRRTTTRHWGLKAASLLQSDIIWPQYAKCNWIPLSWQRRTPNTHTHTHRCFLLASGDVPHYSAYHSLQGCDHQGRLRKGQIYSVWINSSRLKSWVTPWLVSLHRATLLSAPICSPNPVSLHATLSEAIFSQKKHNIPP